jgi:hypothetical protein
LLLYNSHLLWTCRILELVAINATSESTTLGTARTATTTTTVDDAVDTEDQDDPLLLLRSKDPWHYVRLLFGLTVVGLCLDLILTYYILSLLRRANHAISSPITSTTSYMGGTIDNDDHDEQVQRIIYIGDDDGGNIHASLSSSSSLHLPQERLVTRRPISSVTLLTSSLLWIVASVFPTIPLDILPGLSRTSMGSTLLWILGPTMSHVLCLVLLGTLSWSAHPLTSILCGSAAGWLYLHGVLSFVLEDPYWNLGLVLVVVILCLISLKAHESPHVPCIDSVALNHHGRVVRLDAQGRRIMVNHRHYRRENRNPLLEGVDDHDHDHHDLDLDIDASYSSATTSESDDSSESSSSGGGSSSSGSDDHRHDPLIAASNSEEEDGDDVEAMAQSFFLSRRRRSGGGSGGGGRRRAPVAGSGLGGGGGTIAMSDLRRPWTQSSSLQQQPLPLLPSTLHPWQLQPPQQQFLSGGGAAAAYATAEDDVLRDDDNNSHGEEYQPLMVPAATTTVMGDGATHMRSRRTGAGPAPPSFL